MSCKRNASEASKAVNALIHLCDKDQEPLLEVLEDYFTSPIGLDNSDHEFSHEEESDNEKQGVSGVNESPTVDEDEVSDDNAVGVEIREETVVTEALARLPFVPNVEFEPSVFDVNEKHIVKQFLVGQCGCQLWNQKSCSLQLSLQHILNVRSQCAALSHGELDMALLGQLMAMSNASEKVVAESGHSESTRRRNYTKYSHQGLPVCPRMFCFLHCIGETRLKNLAKSLKTNGLTPRLHGNMKCLPKSTLSYSKIEAVVRFLVNYTEKNGLLLPGHIPGYSRSDIKLLPSSVSKRRIWRVYEESALVTTPSVHPVAYSTFCRLWRTLLPAIIIMKPMSDLCWQCQKNSAAILRASNSHESEKSTSLKAAEEHLRVVQLERSFYKTTCDDCRRDVHSFFSVAGSFSPPQPLSKIPVNSNDIRVHHSFDYAQQVHYPSDTLQPGPIFFLTPRKCSIFGVHCEAIPRQVNFLGDEAGDCGKGANSVLSQLHFFFENYGLGEMEALLHADNNASISPSNIHVFMYVTGHSCLLP